MGRNIRIASMGLGLAVLGLATPAAADVDALRAFVARKAGVVELLHNKAEKALVTAAQDATFREYFEASSDAERLRLRERIDHIGLAVQKQFAVEEMCLIDETGTEISRIVGSEIAYDLSTEEASAAFFAPSFAAEPKSVHLSTIYLSPDAHRWVTAYATPILAQGEKKAILHYEHGLDFYEKTLNSGIAVESERVLQTVTGDGFVIFDSQKEIGIEQKGESEDPADYFEAFSLGGLSLQALKDEIGGGDEGAGTVTDPEGKRIDVAFKTLGDWTLVASEPGKDEPS